MWKPCSDLAEPCRTAPRRLVRVAEVEVFLAIPIVAYIGVQAGVGLKHGP